MSSTPRPTKPIEVFYSYAHADEQLRKGLEKQLSLLTLQRLISGWYDRKIPPGQEWADQIDTHLSTAQIILLLISADFMASKYCFGEEMMRAMERHEAGEARVIPVILRHVEWSGAPFSKLQALPTDARPIMGWRSRDKAFLDVARGIRKAVEEIVAKQAAEAEEEAKRAAKAEEELAAKAKAEEELATKAREEADLAAKAGTELTTKLTEVELAAKRVAEATESAKQVAELLAEAQADLEAKQKEADRARQRAIEVVKVRTSNDDSKTPWEVLWELLEEGYSETVLAVMEKAAQRTLALGLDFVDSLVFFEAFLRVPKSAALRALERLGGRVEKIVSLVDKLNEERQEPTPMISSKQELGLSKSVLETLLYARLLANRSGREQTNDKDMLEALVLRKKNAAMQLLAKVNVVPELLLDGAFLESGELKGERFSSTAKTILENVLQRAQKTRLVSTSHLLAALVNIEGSLARKMLWILDYEPDRYVHHLLENTRIHKGQPQPTILNFATCSPRARGVLNLAELLARIDDTLVDEDYLFKAYWQCIGIAQ